MTTPRIEDGARTIGRSADTAPTGRRGLALRHSVIPWAFALPALAVYTAFLIYPAIRSVYISFTDWDGIAPVKKFVGLKNYTDMLHDAVIHTAVRNNIFWALITILVPAVLGLALAMAVNTPVFLKPLLRTIFYTPAVLPLVGVGTIWTWLLDPSGAINEILRDVGLGGLAHAWLGDSSTAIWAAMVPAVWVRTGFPMLLYLAALQAIPAELHESAATEGASRWQRFRYITFPSLRATHYIVIALATIEAVKVFDLVFAMTSGGPGNSTQVMGTWMYFNVFQSYNAGYGTAIAVVVTFVAILVGIPYVRMTTKDL